MFQFKWFEALHHLPLEEAPPSFCCNICLCRKYQLISWYRISTKCTQLSIILMCADGYDHNETSVKALIQVASNACFFIFFSDIYLSFQSWFETPIVVTFMPLSLISLEYMNWPLAKLLCTSGIFALFLIGCYKQLNLFKQQEPCHISK